MLLRRTAVVEQRVGRLKAVAVEAVVAAVED